MMTLGFVVIVVVVGWGIFFPTSIPGRILRIFSAKANEGVTNAEANNALALDQKTIDDAQAQIAKKKAQITEFGGTVNVIRERLKQATEALAEKETERNEVLDLMDDYETVPEGESSDAKSQRERLFQQAEFRVNALSPEIEDLNADIASKQRDLEQAEGALLQVMNDVESLAGQIELAHAAHQSAAGRLQAASLRKEMQQMRTQLGINKDGMVSAVKSSAQRLGDQIARVEGEASTAAALNAGANASADLDAELTARRQSSSVAELRAQRRKERGQQ